MLDQRVQRLADKDEIRELVYAYSFHADHNHPEELAELFVEDCDLDYGEGNSGRFAGRDHLLAWVRESLGGTKGAELNASPLRLVGTSHHNADVRIAFEDDDHATGTVSVYAWHRMLGAPDAEVWGYYFDGYVRTDQGWRFAGRTLRVAGQEGFDVAWNPIERR
jgi:SnoaL-like domain